MTLFICREDLARVAIIDDYVSVLWVARYSDYGEFQLVVPADAPYIKLLDRYHFIERAGAEDDGARLMYIESIKFKSSTRDGGLCEIAGRSIELLTMKLAAAVMDPAYYPVNGVVNDVCKPVIMSYCDGAFIPQLATWISATSYHSIPAATIKELVYGDKQPSGELKTTAYDFLTAICELFQLGFKICLHNNRKLYGKTYEGKNRTATVVFSRDKGNLLESEYTQNWTETVDRVYAALEEKGTPHFPYVPVPDIPEPKEGNLITRKVLLLTRTQFNDPLGRPGAEYEGDKYLSTHQETTTFDCKIDPVKPYEYGLDYFLGDIVRIDDGMGHTANARLVEIATVEDGKGCQVRPKLEVVKGRLPV